MGVLFLLKQQYPNLAVAEAKAAAYGWGWWEHDEQPVDGTLLLQTRRRPQHLALSRFATNVLLACAPADILQALSKSKLPVKGSFRIVVTRQTGSKITEREIAAAVWSRIKVPKVDLRHPDTIIDVIITSSEAYVGIRVWTNDEDFESRRAHLRPVLHPSGMHPALARALVNLSCAASIHDPFCGAGGILVEAGLAHKRASGADIEPAMIARAKVNCNQAKLRPELRVADATMWIPRVQAVIADLPYGKSTRPHALEPLLHAFLHRAQQSTSRAVIGLPGDLVMPREWKVRAHFTVYVHKSMTRHFYVLEKH